MLSNDWMKSWMQRAMWLMALIVFILLAVPSMSAASSSVPPIVITSNSTVTATGLAGGEGNVAVDACGNIYTVQRYGGEVDEIPGGGGAAIVVLAAGGANYDEAVLAMDATQSNLYVVQATSGAIKIPIVNCVPQTASATSVGIGNLPIAGNGWGYLTWYFSMSAVAADTAGNIFMASDVACCASINSLVEEYAQALPAPASPSPYSVGAPLLGWATGLTYPINSMAVDFNNNIYYVIGCTVSNDKGSGCDDVATFGTLYELPVITQATATTQAVYSSTPVLFGSGYSNNVVGVSVDSHGNLYVADGGSSTIYEIPYETTGSTSALNVADQFVVTPNASLVYPGAPDRAGNFYYSSGGSSVYEMIRGGANFGSVTTGSSGTATVNVTFNASVTPATFTVVSASGVFTDAGTGTCTAQAYAAGSSCTVNVSFTPAKPGAAYGSVVLADASHNVLATAYLQGMGLGAGIAMDPGFVTPVGSGFGSPASIAVTSAGGYIADTGKNAVLYFATPSSTGVSFGTGLLRPAGVAVDGAGNLIIADTGNNRIVEVPVVNGVLSNAAQVVLVSATTSIAGSVLKAPAGVTVDGLGNLYIADTGNNRIVYLPYNGGWNVANASTMGSGLNAPLATAIDPSGNLYVADTGNGQIYKLQNGAQQLIAVGYSNPSALAFDASGSLFVVDQGAGIIFRIPSVSGVLDPNSAIEVGFGVSAPYGIALDSVGNLFATDMTHAAAYGVNRISISTLPNVFGNWPLNTASGPWPVQVESAGNQSLIFSTPFDTVTGHTGDFSLSTPSDACADSLTVAAGAGCELDAIFQPTVAGERTETLTLNSNAKNTASAQVVLDGTGVAATATTTVLAITSPASGTPSFGQAITLTATVTSASGIPTGSAMLLVDGVISAEAALSGAGVATFSLPTGLTGGSHTLLAIYLGTTTFDGSISAIKTISVGTAPTASAMAITAPFINPYSALPGNAVTFTVTIGFAGVGIPTGTVTFVTGSTTLGTANVSPVAGGLFQASLTTTALPLGTDLVTATYSGDANYIGSATSGTVIVVSGPTVVLTSNGTALTAGSGSIAFSQVSEGGWNGIVGYSCLESSLPANSRCIWSPGQGQVMPSTSAATAYQPIVNLSIAVDQPPQTRTGSKLVWWLGGMTGLLLFFARRRWMRGAWATMTMLIAVALLGISASGLMACNTGVPATSTSPYATPAGTTTITVYASADPFTTAPTSSTPTPPTQPCGIIPGSNPPTASPALAPCSQKAYQISVTVLP